MMAFIPRRKPRDIVPLDAQMPLSSVKSALACDCLTCREKNKGSLEFSNSGSNKLPHERIISVESSYPGIARGESQARTNSDCLHIPQRREQQEYSGRPVKQVGV